MTEQIYPSKLGSLTALTIFASYNHSDRLVRRRLKEKLRGWIQDCEPNHDRKDIRRALLSVSGTLLEPFRLTKQDLEIATDLAQIAFSDLHMRTRIRIVSADTFGTGGGCVLTSNLASYFVERFSLGRRKITPNEPWFFAPSMTPTNPIKIARRPSTPSASCIVASTGYRIRIRGLSSSPVAGEANGTSPVLTSWISERLSKRSTIGASALSLSDLGCRAEVSEGQIDIFTTSPEAMVRLTVRMAKREVLTLNYTDFANPPILFFVWLQPPKAKTTKLNIVATADEGALQQWIRMIPATAPLLEDGDVYDISKCHPPLHQWANPSLIENLQ